MDTRYPVMWTRRNGERVAVEELRCRELRAAARMLVDFADEDPIAAAMHDAVSLEIEARAAGSGHGPALAAEVGGRRKNAA